MSARKDFTASEWGILFGVAAAAIAVTESIGMSQKWEDAIVFTTVLFTTITVVLRKLWGNRTFWRNLFLLLALHTFIVSIAVQSSTAGSTGFPKLLLILLAMCE